MKEKIYTLTPEIKEEEMKCEYCGCPCDGQFCSKECKKEYEFDNK